VTIAGELPKTDRRQRLLLLVLPAGLGEVLADGIKNLAHSKHLTYQSQRTPCLGIDFRGRVLAGASILRGWKGEQVCVVLIDNPASPEITGRRCTWHRRR
jgi:hypothetical protein